MPFGYPHNPWIDREPEGGSSLSAQRDASLRILDRDLDAGRISPEQHAAMRELTEACYRRLTSKNNKQVSEATRLQETR
jgi:hypothetical protein